MSGNGAPEGARPRFSVISVNYNGKGLTARAVESVRSQEGIDAEVLVVDNASTDGSVEELEALAAARSEVPLTLIHSGSNLGFARACNMGMARARGDLVVLLNNDAVLEAGALAEVDRAARAHPEAASFALSVRFRDRPDTLNSTGLVVFFDGTAVDRHYGRPLAAGPSKEDWVAGAMGGGAAWRREALERLGYFGADFFLYSEDVDLALRAQRAGLGCLYLPAAVVLHDAGSTVSREPSQRVVDLQLENAARVLARNFGGATRARGLVVFALRVVTANLRHGRVSGRARARALRFLWRERKSLAAQRAKIKELGPDERVSKWLYRRAP